MAAKMAVRELESKGFALGASLVFFLTGLPRGRRVSHFMLEFDGTISNDEATDHSCTTRNIARLFSFIEHQSRFFSCRATGLGLTNLYQHMNGKSLDQSTVNVTGTEIACTGYVKIPIVDPRSAKPNDCAIPTEYLENTSIELKTVAAETTAGFNAHLTVKAGSTCRMYAYLVEGSGAAIPPKTRIDYEDWSGQTVRLKRGKTSHLQIYAEDDTAQTLAGISRVDMECDGVKVINNVRTEALVIDFNDKVAKSGSITTDQEDLVDTTTGYRFVPAVTPDDKYIISQLAESEDSLLVNLSGSVTANRFLYRNIEPHNEGDLAFASEKFGLNPATAKITVRTLKSGTPLSGAKGTPAGDRTAMLRKYLPKRAA